MEDLRLVYNKETGMWEEHKEAYATIEVDTEEDYEYLLQAVEFYKKRDNLAEVDKAIEWLAGYAFADDEQVYTNGAVLIPLFRVEQALKDKAYNGLLEG